MMTKEEFLELRSLGLTFVEIGDMYGLTERQVNYRTKKWGLDFSKKKDLDHNFFSSNTKAAYYWAGFIAADGWIEEDRNRIGIALKSEDLAHLEKFKVAVKSSHNICPFMDNTAYRIRFNSEKMCKDLLSIFNITSAKTFTYKMPFFEDDYLMIEFLRGYIDGDGHFSKRGTDRIALHLCSAQKSFLFEVLDICSLLLNRVINQEPKLQLNKKGQVYNIVFTQKDSKDLINILYKNSTNATRLDRKYLTASCVLTR